MTSAKSNVAQSPKIAHWFVLTQGRSAISRHSVQIQCPQPIASQLGSVLVHFRKIISQKSNRRTGDVVNFPFCLTTEAYKVALEF